MSRKPKRVEDAERFKSQSVKPLNELFPRAHYRLASLKDGDGNLMRLMALFESEGMPFGSEAWPIHCAAFLRRLIDYRNIFYRLLREYAKDGKVDMESAVADANHARAMHSKRKPRAGLECYFCGHHDAERVGRNAVCPQCAEEHASAVAAWGA